jgi:uncharacterized cupin superfamily protein
MFSAAAAVRFGALREGPPPGLNDRCRLRKRSVAVDDRRQEALSQVLKCYEEATMARGSTVFRPADLSESNASSYPEPFREGQRKRYTRRLGDHAGLKNYGVNLVRVLPGGQSSARHTHSKQDEFVYVVEGEFVLVTDAGRETVGPGTCIGFPAGTGDGHHFLNLTQKDAIFLVIGDRTAGDEVTYPDIDLELKAGPDGVRGFRRKDGTPYPRAARD